jgi:hypothetical protein
MLKIDKFMTMNILLLPWLGGAAKSFAFFDQLTLSCHDTCVVENKTFSDANHTSATAQIKKT